MGDDLEAPTAEVHAAAHAVLAFWFEETPSDKWFGKDAAFDAAIAERFSRLRDQLLADGAAGWKGHPDTLLAAIIALDQFSRNIYRDSGNAFAADTLALSLTHLALEKGWDTAMPPEQRIFLYLPLMHAEDRDQQALSVECYNRLGLKENFVFAQAHRDVIEHFGRFPSRNAALGRTSSTAEAAYLSEPGAGW